MKRRDFLQVTSGTLIGAALSGRSGADVAPGVGRPNILWITCEDISPHLGCYGDPEARTPHLDRLATEGARYTNAFSVSGVCAPSRSCLISGMYPTTLGTCHMRCNHLPPAHVKCFPEYLREAGYYCTNNVKTDYNFDPPASAWDVCSRKAHWRGRPDTTQPFFAVFNFTVTHESQVGTPMEKIRAFREKLPPEDRHDPAKATLPPYYPDTPLVRKHWAHYYDLISIMDQQAGDILEQLEEDGLADNTIVFFFSDHGVGLPRAKRWLYDSGIHVPFIVRWPGHIEPNSVCERLVSFVDFAPTVLSLAGVPIPEHMQGRAFLAAQATPPPRQYVFAARDRMDERYDIIRAARDSRFKYIRNYEPYRPYAQYLAYPEGWPVMQEMRRVRDAGKLQGPERLFFRETKPVEELYDIATDPHEVHNLAESPEHETVLARMRRALDDWIDETKDLGLVPELELEAWLQPGGKKLPKGLVAPSNEFEGVKVKYAPAQNAEPAVFGRSIKAWIDDLNGTEPLCRLRAIKALGLIGTEAAPILVDSLSDPDSAVVHWGAVALGYLDAKSPVAPSRSNHLLISFPYPPISQNSFEGVKEALVKTLKHPAVGARLGAARALCRWGDYGDALPVVLDAAADDDPYVRLYAVQVLETLECGGPQVEAVRDALQKALDDRTKYVVRVAEHALDHSTVN